MKLFNILNKASILLFIASIVACSDQVEISNPQESIVAIPEESITMFEDEAVEVQARFSKAPISAGTINVTFSGSAVYGQDFTTEPAGSADGVSIPVEANSLGTSLRLLGIANAGLNPTKNVSLSFSSEGGINFGAQAESEVMILNRPETLFDGNLTDFGQVMELEKSDAQAISISAVGLIADLAIESSENFEISLNDSDYSATLSLPLDDINDGDTTLFVRFAPQFDAIGNITGQVTLLSENAVDNILTVTGEGTEQPPTLFASTTAIAFSSVPQGTVSTSQLLEVSGYRLTQDVVVTAPDNFEVSLDDDGFSPSVELDFTEINDEGVLSIYVRFAPNTGVDGEKTGELVLASPDFDDISISLSGQEGLIVVAYTSFEEPEGLDSDYIDTGDAAVNRTLENNDGQAPVQYDGGNELGFRTVYISTGGVGATDGDDLGVTTKTSIVGDSPQGGYTDGDQGYYVDDTDGIIQLVLDEVDVTGLTTLELKVDYLFNDSTWEPEDQISMTLITNDGVPLNVLTLTGDDIEAMGLDPEPHIWTTLTADASSLLGTATSVRLVIEIQTDSAAEEVYFDNIIFQGI